MISVSFLFLKLDSKPIFIQIVLWKKYISSLFIKSSNSDQIVKIVMAERVHIVFYFLLLSQGFSRPMKDLSIELCDTSFREILHFSVALGDCTTSLPLTVTGYNTTTSLASNASPTTTNRLPTLISYESTMSSPASRTTTSFESIVTGLNYQELNGSLPSEYDTRWFRNTIICWRTTIVSRWFRTNTR